MTLKMLNHH